MAEQKRNQNRANKKRPLRYFFLNGELHRKFTINKGKDIVITWNYPQRKRITYSYTDVLRRKEKAFSTSELCQIVNRHRDTIELARNRGKIAAKHWTYDLESGKIVKYFWTEEDVMDVLEYFSNVHNGRPRKDGLITNNNLPTPREARAMMRDEQILYVKQGDSFIPTWKARDI